MSAADFALWHFVCCVASVIGPSETGKRQAAARRMLAWMVAVEPSRAQVLDALDALFEDDPAQDAWRDLGGEA